jgi:tetratricopeptide (TPR) repeat protein
MGLCNSLRSNQPEAIQRYQQAIDAGWESAEVLNNQGYSYFLLGKIAQARHCLNEAIAQNPELAVAYHNRALVGLRQLLSPKQPECEGIMATMLADIRAAMARRPLSDETARLYGDAACIYARAARDDGHLDKLIESYFCEATEHGQDPVALRNDLITAYGKSHFETLPMKPPIGKPVPILHVVDPVPGIPAELLLGH